MNHMRTRKHFFTAACLLAAGLCVAPMGGVGRAASEDRSAPEYGIRLEGYEYPFPVQTFLVGNGDADLEMVYMDVVPRGTPKGTVVLLHGKNFCGAYWEQTARDLANAGYRVVIPDQIGFGKSSKPLDYQFSFHRLANNTKLLLDDLGIERASVVGHSMGGMLAARFAVMYPDVTDRLVLVNPIGLEHWAAKGVPYRGIDAWYARELRASAESIRRYQLESYYDGDWEPEYQEWVDLLAGMTTSEEYPRLARVQAHTYDMIYSQPVVQDFPSIKAPSMLIIGGRDRTALGKDLVDDSLRSELGLYPNLAREAAAAIPDARLVLLDGIGHLPQIEAYDQYIEPLMQFLEES